MPQSVAGSVISRHSMKSGKSKASYVDETLFGSNKKIENGQSQMAKAGATILSINELRKIREQTDKGLQKDAAILSKTELDRIRKASIIMTKDQQDQEKQIMEEQKVKQMEMHNARKKRMFQMDKERNNKLLPNEFEVEDHSNKERTINRAQEILDQEKDDVKTMNQMVLYAKWVTIRDKQLNEQKRLENEYCNNHTKISK